MKRVPRPFTGNISIEHEYYADAIRVRDPTLKIEIVITGAMAMQCAEPPPVDRYARLDWIRRNFLQIYRVRK